MLDLRGRGAGPSLAARFAAHAGGCARVALVSGGAFLAVLALAGAALFGGLIVLYRFVDPPATPLMLFQALQGTPITRTWVPLERISPHLVSAVVMSEDARFCRHSGVDFRELDAALGKAERNGDEFVRGASTITMQVAKNVFLWPDKSYLRKAIEVALAFGLETVWTKDRILEVYLNIAEWGPGVFGAEAAARHHFATPAARLTARQAALLAVSLPNPIARTAGKPGSGTARLAFTIERRMIASGGALTCVQRRGARRGAT